MLENEEQYLLVIRSDDVEVLYSLVKRMGRMREPTLRELGRALEGELNGRHK